MTVYYIKTEQETYDNVESQEGLEQARWFWRDETPIVEAFIYVEDETMGRWLRVYHPHNWPVRATIQT